MLAEMFARSKNLACSTFVGMNPIRKRLSHTITTLKVNDSGALKNEGLNTSRRIQSVPQVKNRTSGIHAFLRQWEMLHLI